MRNPKLWEAFIGHFLFILIGYIARYVTLERGSSLTEPACPGRRNFCSAPLLSLSSSETSRLEVACMLFRVLQVDDV
uniref:Secreted protein n=1 Tax=Steinernema glaseri TaxID=37863 RepID=A0A1I7ZBD6_9BILA